MTDTDGMPLPADGAALGELCAQARDLARQLPGPLRRLVLHAGDARVEVEWDPTGSGGAAARPVSAAAPGSGAEPAASDDDATGEAVTAPLVGTFYRAPEPGARPFVEEGDTVEAGQDVAIIEAMKIMNRIESQFAGTVTAILVDDGDMVEFGQPLLLVEPA